MDETKQVTVDFIIDETLDTTWNSRVTIPVPDNLTPDQEFNFIYDYLFKHESELLSEENITDTKPLIVKNWHYAKEVARLV